MITHKYELSEMPLISIMMPCYNSLSTLAISISSLICQTYENWELIFVDDGSTDGSADFVEQISDSRIKIYRLLKNRGRPYARQRALEETRGEVVGMLDADDWYLSEKLEKQIAYLQDNSDVGLVSSGMIIYDHFINKIRLNRCYYISKRKISKSELFPNIPHAPTLIRSILAKQYSYNTYMRRCQDIDYLRKITRRAYYASLGEPLYVYNSFANAIKNDIIAFNCIKKLLYDNLSVSRSKYNSIVLKLWIKMFGKYILFKSGLAKYVKLMTTRGEWINNQNQYKLISEMEKIEAIASKIS